MSIAALIAWVVTALAGFLLLSIWIIEYDREFQSAAATRLPVPVISAHALLAVSGLVLWILYLILDETRVAWAAVGVLGAVAVLGLIMAARWIPVYRAFAAPGPSLTRRIPSLRNGTSRCRSSSPTASWPSPPSFWCCSPRLALARRDQPPAQAASPARRNLTAIPHRNASKPRRTRMSAVNVKIVPGET